MSRTLTIPGGLYEKLENTARKRGYQEIENLLEAWQIDEEKSQDRREIVQRINVLRERLHSKYGQMADSTTLVREDRTR